MRHYRRATVKDARFKILSAEHVGEGALWLIRSQLKMFYSRHYLPGVTLGKQEFAPRPSPRSADLLIVFLYYFLSPEFAAQLTKQLTGDIFGVLCSIK